MKNYFLGIEISFYQILRKFFIYACNPSKPKLLFVLKTQILKPFTF